MRRAQLDRQLQRIGCGRQGVKASPLAARRDQASAPVPTTSGASMTAAASAGGQVEESVVGAQRGARTAGRTARHGRRRMRAATEPSPGAPAASSASDDMPAQRARPSRSPGPARRRSPTRMPVKLPGPTPTRMRGPAPVEHLLDHRHQALGMAAADDLVARARPAPVAVEQARRCRRRSTCRSPGSRQSCSVVKRGLGHKPLAGASEISEPQTASTVSTSGT